MLSRNVLAGGEQVKAAVAAQNLDYTVLEHFSRHSPSPADSSRSRPYSSPPWNRDLGRANDPPTATRRFQSHARTSTRMRPSKNRGSSAAFHFGSSVIWISYLFCSHPATCVLSPRFTVHRQDGFDFFKLFHRL